MAAQETLFVGIEDSHERHLGQVQTLAQEIDTDEHIIYAGAEVIEDANAVHRIYIAMNVSRLDTELDKVVIELLSHALGQRGHESTLTALGAQHYLLKQVIDLVHSGSYLDDGVKKARWAYELLHHDTAAEVQLIVSRRGAHVYHLMCHALKFLKLKRPIVKGGLKAETIVHEIELAREIAAIHSPDLRHCDVALIDYRHKVLREIIQQAEWAHTRLASIKISGVILDAGAVAYLLHHLHIVSHALLQPLGLKEPILLAEILHLHAQIELYLLYGFSLTRRRSDKDICRVNVEAVKVAEFDAISGVHRADALYFIAPKDYAQGDFLVSEPYIYGVAFDSESAALSLYLIARIKRAHELAQKGIAGDTLPHLDRDDIGIEILRIADAVETRHRRHHYDIAAPRQQS